MDKLNISLQHPTNQVYASKIVNFLLSLSIEIVISTEVGQMIILLWQDNGFQQCIQCTIEYQLSDFKDKQDPQFILCKCKMGL